MQFCTIIVKSMAVTEECTVVLGHANAVVLTWVCPALAVYCGDCVWNQQENKRPRSHLVLAVITLRETSILTYIFHDWCIFCCCLQIFFANCFIFKTKVLLVFLEISSLMYLCRHRVITKLSSMSNSIAGAQYKIV